MTFNLTRLAEVIRTDATVPSKVDFLATHTPFGNLRYVVSGITDKGTREIDEETFLQREVFNKRNKHQFIVIQGGNGSGKSHLIRWIKERYISQVDPEKEAVLLIVRAQNTLKGALEQIISANIFPQGMELNNIAKLVEAKNHLSKEALKQNIAVQFALAAQDAYALSVLNGTENALLEKRYMKKVYPFLTDQHVQDFLCQPDKAIDRIYRRLSADGSGLRQDALEPRFLVDDLVVDLKMLDKMRREEANRKAISLAEDLHDSVKGPELRVKLAQFLNQHLEFVIQSCTNLRSADLKNIFEQLRVALKQAGKMLTLFIEDITSFTGIDRALVEVLVTEHAGSSHNESFCRLFSVVGVTNDYYQTSFPDNLKERVTGRIFVDQAILNTPQELAEMTARYNNAISQSDTELEVWVKGGAKDEDLPIASEHFSHKWALFTLADGREFSIYPFNINSLANMYNSLQLKTPRRFLQDVVAHMIRTYTNCVEGEFPPSVADFEGEFSVPLMKDPNHETVVRRQAGQHGNQLITLLRLWGDGTAAGWEQDGVPILGGLTEEVFSSFKLPFIEGVRLQGKPLKSGNTPQPMSEPQVPTVIPQPPSLNKGQSEFDKIRKELEEWLNKNSKLESYQDFRDDVRTLLLEFIDWDAEEIPAPVVSAFFTTQRISIEGQRGRSYDGFQVTRSEQSESALLALAAWRILGKKSWNFKGAVDYLNNLYNWLSTIKDQVVATLQCPQGEVAANWDLPCWGLLAHYYVQALSGKSLEKNSVDAVYDSIFQVPVTVDQQEDRSNEWRALQVRLKQINSTITNSHEQLRRYYNRMQGSITATTEVYFIDAVPLLKIIKQLQQSDWDLTVVDTEIAKDKEDTLWVWSLKIINLLKERVEQALSDEMEQCKLLMLDLKQYAGISDADVDALFTEMLGFLRIVLPGANEAYTEKNFKALLEGELTATKYKRRLKTLQGAAQAVGVEQLLRLSSHPMQQVTPYLNQFKSMDRLLDIKNNKFQLTLESLAVQGSTEVSEIIQKASMYLTSLKEDYAKITQEAKIC